MRKGILFLIAICNASGIYAETIDGPANIRSEPNGKVIATIENGEKLNIRGYRNGWYKVEMPAYVYRKDASDGSSYIPVHTNLYNIEGKLIGTILGKTKFIQGRDSDDDRVEGVIYGFTAIKNIRPESILESEIEKLLVNRKLYLETDWSNHIKKSGYESLITYGDFESFEVFEEFGLEITPSPRIILFFYKKKLFAIYHTKPINYSHFQSGSKFLFGHIHYVEQLPEGIDDDFEREFLMVLGGSG